jgi:Rps23 Pro-64 3,4-dihydroxylase Tpa1-like proline 4-hydroxylase
MSADPVVRLNPGLEPTAIAEVYARHGRVHIPAILPPDVAERVHRALAADTPWNRVVRGVSKHYDLAPGSWEAQSDERRGEILQAVYAQGRGGFGYLYENFPIADHHEAGRHLDSFLMRVFEFLNSAPFLDFARSVTRDPSIAFADAQATRYSAGDFLTAHDDAVDGKHRRAAYVLNFTRAWRADWGGLLHFLDRDGHVAEAYTPAFNALNLLRVPQPHAVTYVNPLAGGARLSITGWLRAREVSGLQDVQDRRDQATT